MPHPNPIFPLVVPVEAPAWAKVVVAQKAAQEGVMGHSVRVDLCEDCTGVLTEQFLKGAAVASITQPAGKVELPHDDMLFQDCLLAFDPARGRLICEHDDPERFLKLQTDRAQNVAEGVPEQPVDKTNWVRCKDCDCTGAVSVACQCECHSNINQQLVDRIGQLASDVQTAGYAHSTVQRHIPCGHMYPGTPCDWNQCKTPGRMISQQGEDLTDAFAPQPPAQEGE